MTPIDPTTLKTGDKVAHADAPEFLFEVKRVGGDEEGVFEVDVRSSLTQETYTFEADSRTPSTALDRIVAPPAVSIPSVGRVDHLLDLNHLRLARSTFAGFRLVGGHRQVGAHTRRWFFTGEKHNNCCFHLVTWPGYLVVTGDVGDCLWSRTENMLEWAARGIDDRQYMMGKVPAQMREKQWASEKARAHVDRWYAGQVEQRLFDPPTGTKSDLRADLRELGDRRRQLSGCVSNEFEFYIATTDVAGWPHDDYPDCRRPPNNYEWCHSALQVGLELLGYLPTDLCLPKTEGSTPKGGDDAEGNPEQAATESVPV